MLNPPKFKQGDPVIALNALDEVIQSTYTQGGVWMYRLKGSNRLWEERLLMRAPAPTKPAAAAEREPGQEG